MSRCPLWATVLIRVEKVNFSWNGDLNFNIRDVEFSLYSFNLFKVTSSSNDAISTAFIAISNSYDEISTWIV